MNNLELSDKFFWHGYVDFYETFFKTRQLKKIAEIGVSRGYSIRWLLKRFPEAQIHGADIVPVQEEWPVDPRFHFMQLDQGDPKQLATFFSDKDFDLIIEDGSHQPEHQILGMLQGLPALKSGGLYILEDVHTSHPERIRKARRLFAKLATPPGTALSVLLAIDHYQRLSMPINQEKAALIAKNSLMTAEQVQALAQSIGKVHFYRRTRLPDHCIRCGSKDYDFSIYRCQCGLRVFSDSDSMTFVLEKK